MSYFHAWSTVDDESSVAASEMDRENSYVSAGRIQHKNNSNAKENKNTGGESKKKCKIFCFCVRKN